MVTDSWGNTHQLYEDYLDQGKTVVIKVFYVACPPCNAIAPFLEPLYQSWGAGQADVQFIELSILQSDSDSKINVYKNTHSTTFPACGGEGESVSAVAPYKSGMFGIYTGTPTFVVIAPDKTVNYDVTGINIQTTIEALDAAIEATGADGMNTAIEELSDYSSIRLQSNLVQDEMVLNILQETSGLEVSIYTPQGQLSLNQKLFVQKGETVPVDISALPSGMWICRVTERDQRSVASYLFVKI